MPLDPPPDPSVTPVWWLASSWISVTCACGRSTALPTRLTPHERWDLTLAAYVGRLRCRACGRAPREAFLADRADTFGVGGPSRGRRAWLIGGDRE